MTTMTDAKPAAAAAAPKAGPRTWQKVIYLSGTNSFLMALCTPEQEGVAATDRLLRPAFGLNRLEWPGENGVEFHLSHGQWIALLRRSGFEIEDLVELRPPATTSRTRYPFVRLKPAPVQNADESRYQPW